MARIRSLHPGFWTDEAILALSLSEPYAVLALMGIWGEADDHGAFDWKPVVLKARALGGTNVDFSALMARLEEENCIKKVLINGRPVGLVRNFLVWQSPRKPTYRHAVTPEMLEYLGVGRRKAPIDGALSEDDDDTATGSDDDKAPPPTVPAPVPVQHHLGKVTADGEGEGKGEGKGKGEGEDLSSVPDEAMVAVAMWNRMATKWKMIPKALSKLSAERRTRITARLKDHLEGLEGWQMMLEKIEASPLLRGEGERNWSATIDWVTQPKNLTKIMEGNYDARSPGIERNPLTHAIKDLQRRISESDLDS